MGQKGTEKDRIVGKNIIEGRRTDGNRRRRTENVQEQILHNTWPGLSFTLFKIFPLRKFPNEIRYLIVP